MNPVFHVLTTVNLRLPHPALFLIILGIYGVLRGQVSAGGKGQPQFKCITTFQ